MELLVSEGHQVTAGQRISAVRDDKIGFQVAAPDAQPKALQAQLLNAETELAHDETPVGQGAATAQRLDQLRSQADMARNRIASTEAQRQVALRQEAEGEILAPLDGRVLALPAAVVMAGEAGAAIGFFLRPAIPERHAALLREGGPSAASRSSSRPWLR